MCSTPFGIYEVGTEAAIQLLPDIQMCSTPFGIYEVGTIDPDRGSTFASMCSTPFGIYEVGTLTGTPTTLAGYGCSTPFGIYEVGTVLLVCSGVNSPRAQRLSASMRLARLPLKPKRKRKSAQRLSASMRLAPDQSLSPLIGCKCSTPFGIYEVGTITGKPTLANVASAQRLSASMRLAPDNVG